MARNLDPKCRQCRREGGKLFLKGEKCFTDKCAIERRSYAPASTARSPAPVSPTTACHLRAKQKIRRVMASRGPVPQDLSEAERKKGQTGEKPPPAARDRASTPSPTAWALGRPAPNPARSSVTTASWNGKR